MNTITERARGPRGPSAVACGRNAESSRCGARREGARRRPRARPALRSRPRGAQRDDPSQRDAGRALGAGHGEAVRRHRRRAGAQAEGLLRPRRPAGRLRVELLAAHAGACRIGGGACDRASGGRDRHRPIQRGAPGRNRACFGRGHRRYARGGPFAPKADAADITNFLVANKASLVDGPKNGAIYTIRLPETGQAKDELIKRMQAQTTIVEFIATVQ